jgi:hypothetical protein
MPEGHHHFHHDAAAACVHPTLIELPDVALRPPTPQQIPLFAAAAAAESSLPCPLTIRSPAMCFTLRAKF